MSYHVAENARRARFARGLGAAPSATALNALASQASKLDPTYASKVVNALTTVVGNSAAAQELTPIVRMGASLVDMAYSELSTLSSGIDVGSLKTMALSLANELLDLPESELSMVGDVGGAIGEAIPIIQSVVSMYEAVNTMLAQAQDARIQAQIQACATHFRPIVGTGPNLTPKPADIFVAGWTKAIPAQTTTGPTGTVFVLAPAVPAKPIPSSVGAALIALTECAGRIPVATRALFRLLRHAIEESARDPARTDGGEQVWPVYIDLLRSEFDNGDLTEPYAMSVWYAASGDGADLVATPYGFAPTPPVADDAISPAFMWTGADEPLCTLTPSAWSPTPLAQIVADYKAHCSANAAAACNVYINCLDIDQRPILGVFQMVDAWRATIQPKWGSDIIALSDEQAFIAEALRAAKAQLAGALPSSTATSTPSATKVSASPVLLLATPTKTPAIVALLFGAAAVGGALYIIKKRKTVPRARAAR